MASSTRLVILIKNIYTLWGWRRIWYTPLTLRVTGINMYCRLPLRRYHFADSSADSTSQANSWMTSTGKASLLCFWIRLIKMLLPYKSNNAKRSEKRTMCLQVLTSELTTLQHVYVTEIIWNWFLNSLESSTFFPKVKRGHHLLNIKIVRKIRTKHATY